MKRISEQEAITTLQLYQSCGENAARAAAQLGISASTFKGRLDAARRGTVPAAMTKVAETAPTAIEPEVDRLKAEVFELKAQLKSVRSNTVDDDYVKAKIIGLTNDASRLEVPKWAIELPTENGQPGVPTTFWSDWHWGERVFKTQVNGVNEYDLAIAHIRAKKLVTTVTHLLRNHIVSPTYPGIVTALGGDMFSGDIHEELTTTNEIPLLPTLLDLYVFLVWAITVMADEFGYVFLPCVTGNHGRNTKKMQAKNRNFTNFDWLLYQLLAKNFENDPRVTFFIPDGPDALYRVYGHRYLLTHGDQFRGGDGMIGHFGPVLRGEKKKLSRNSNVGQEFDTMLHGHFHTYFPTMKIIGNGSLKGYDEYASANNFGYEPPIQAMWLTHHKHGITQNWAVYLEQHTNRQQASEWVSLPAAA